MSGIKNADGTVNFEGMKQHLNYVKGKYAQNAENYKKNTGHEMGFGGDNDKDDAQAGVTEGKEEHAYSNASHKGGQGAPTDAALHDERKSD